MSIKKNINLVHQYWDQCWNLHNSDNLKNTHHTAFSQNGVVVGINAFKQSIDSFFNSFPDVQTSIEDVIAQGDRVLMRVVYHGTHKGVYEDVQPTLKKISVSGLELFLLMDGKIVHHWHEMDHLEILKQIGATAIVPKE